VQSVLAARIDRLAERDKRLLQTAEVIGKDFSDSLLRAVVAASSRDPLPETELRAALETLARAEFVFEQSLFPEVEYAFKHPLTQEVAYRSQLAARRGELHAAVARAMEEIGVDKLDERAALLAYHWEQAGEALVAARWYARAAEVAGLNSPDDALLHWEKVRSILIPVAESEKSVELCLHAASQLLMLGWRQGTTGDRADEIFAEGKALAVRHRDVREQVRLLYGVGACHLLSETPRRAITYFEEAVDLADAAADPELRGAAREPFEYALALVGELATALRMNDEVSSAEPTIGSMIGFISTAHAFTHRGWILTDLGRFPEAAAAFRRCQELAERYDDNDEVISMKDAICCRLLERTGDVLVAVSTGRRAVESAEKIGNHFTRVFAHGFHGSALGLSGDWDAARRSLELALEVARKNRVALLLEADHLAALAEAYLGLEDAQRARELAEEAIQVASFKEMPVAEVRAQLALARVLRELGGVAERNKVEAGLDRASQLVHATEACSYEPQIHLERARLAALLSDSAAVERGLLPPCGNA
jgi:adenylate cyclase